MRVALLCLDRGVPFGGPKGCSVHLRSVAAALLRAGHAVTVWVSNGQSCAEAGALVARGVEHRVLGEGVTREALCAALVAERPDQILERLALLAPQGALAAADAGIPHAYEVNAPLDEEAAAHRGFEGVDAARAAFREGFAASRCAVAVSDEVAEWVRALAPATFPVAVVPNGAGPEFLATPDAARVARVRERLSLPAGEILVGFAGSFRPWHDLPTLVRAVARLAREAPARLLLVGDGPQRAAVVQLTADCGTPLSCTGTVDHLAVPDHLALCDIVAVPYDRADAYFSPLKLIEAMAAGRAVVASATAPVRRIVRDRTDAWLVPPGDERSLASALIVLAGDPALRSSLGAAARRTVEQRHTWDAVVARVLAFAADPSEAPCAS